MKKLINEHGWYHNQFFMGGGPSIPDTPAPPSPPPPPAPPPKEADADVAQQDRETAEKKKFQRGREKTMLEQTQVAGTKKKASLLGQTEA